MHVSGGGFQVYVKPMFDGADNYIYIWKLLPTLDNKRDSCEPLSVQILSSYQEFAKNLFTGVNGIKDETNVVTV